MFFLNITKNTLIWLSIFGCRPDFAVVVIYWVQSAPPPFSFLLQINTAERKDGGQRDGQGSQQRASSGESCEWYSPTLTLLTVVKKTPNTVYTGWKTHSYWKRECHRRQNPITVYTGCSSLYVSESRRQMRYVAHLKIMKIASFYSIKGFMQYLGKVCFL
jgi:hypothetical protein